MWAGTHNVLGGQRKDVFIHCQMRSWGWVARRICGSIMSSRVGIYTVVPALMMGVEVQGSHLGRFHPRSSECGMEREIGNSATTGYCTSAI